MVAAALSPALALVGDIPTVEEAHEPDIVGREDGSLLVDGTVAVERFRDVAGLEEQLPGEEAESYHTLGGFAMPQLGRVPQVGDRFESCGFQFAIVDMDKNRGGQAAGEPHPGRQRPGRRLRRLT